MGCGSCVHTSREAIGSQLDQYVAVLRPNGVLGISLQAGAPTTIGDDGRFFERYDEAILPALIESRGLRIVNVNTQISLKSTMEIKVVKKWVGITAIVDPAVNEKGPHSK